MKLLRFIIPLTAALCLFCAPAAGPKDAVELVPADNEISGWARSGTMAVCENQDALFALIDGEGQTYVDNGFVKSAFQTYRGTVGSATIDLYLRVFDMSDSSHSGSVYAAVALGTEQPWTGTHAGTEARTDESALASYRVDFYQDKFYVSVTIMDKTTPAQDIARLFALNISSAIGD